MAAMPSRITGSRGRARNIAAWELITLGLLVMDAAMWLYVAALPAKLLG